MIGYIGVHLGCAEPRVGGISPRRSITRGESPSLPPKFSQLVIVANEQTKSRLFARSTPEMCPSSPHIFSPSSDRSYARVRCCQPKSGMPPAHPFIEQNTPNLAVLHMDTLLMRRKREGVQAPLDALVGGSRSAPLATGTGLPGVWSGPVR